MKLDQVAFIAQTPEAKDHLKNLYGLQDEPWIVDIVTGLAKTAGRLSIVKAELLFCMKLGMQFELLRILEGRTWLDGGDTYNGGLAHIGFHLDEGEPFPPYEEGTLAMEMVTLKHTNPEILKAERRYHYRICNHSPGIYTKFIRRIQVHQVEAVAKEILGDLPLKLNF